MSRKGDVPFPFVVNMIRDKRIEQQYVVNAESASTLSVTELPGLRKPFLGMKVYHRRNDFSQFMLTLKPSHGTVISDFRVRVLAKGVFLETKVKNRELKKKV